MEPINPDILIQEADLMIKTASNELDRPSEDVTSHMVCLNARQSILNYLISYLHKNGVSLQKPITMAGLMEQCRTLDGRFNLIDLSPINCRHKEDPEDYCMEVNTVSECLKIAKQTRAIALDESPAY